MVLSTKKVLSLVRRKCLNPTFPGDGSETWPEAVVDDTEKCLNPTFPGDGSENDPVRPGIFDGIIVLILLSLEMVLRTTEGQLWVTNCKSVLILLSLEMVLRY